MQWSDIDFRPQTRTLRQFALLWLVFFGGLAAWEGVGRGRMALGAALGLLAVTVGPLGYLRPQWLRPIYVGWMVLAFPIGWVVSRVVLALAFYFLFAPLGLAFRLAGRDPLQRRRRSVETYWAEKPAVRDVRRYFQQF
ncbi:MAG TPA: SxtJ family membrane protein [Pirellulales bacterium]|nr:SxtJ family membrane protein [Pirellulales bacterium]